MSTTYYLSPFEKDGYDKNEKGASNFTKEEIENLPYYYGFASRNYDLKKGFNSPQETTGIKLNLESKLRQIQSDTGMFLALQGELVGVGIQKNYYNLDGIDWYCFDILDCKTRKYLNPEQRRKICEEYAIPQVPLLEFVVIDESLNNVEYFVKNADGKSRLNLNKNREGLVFKSLKNPDVHTFKAISNNYLLKNDNDDESEEDE
jgi:ATP-dependent RNA circularization protein (DNA/RNA ligase family)